MNPSNIGLAAKAALVLCLFLSVAMSVQVTLPAIPVTLEKWYSPYDYAYREYYWSQPSPTWNSSNLAGKNYFNLSTHVYWRSIVYPDSHEEIIDNFSWDGHVATSSAPVDKKNCPYGCSDTVYYSDHVLPKKTIDLPLGNYTLKLYHVKLNASTASRFPGAGPDSVIDLWNATKIEYDRDHASWTDSFNLHGYHVWLCSNVSPAEYRAGTLSLFDPPGYAANARNPSDPYNQRSMSETCESQGAWYAGELANFSYVYHYETQWQRTDNKVGWFEKLVARGVKVSSLGKVEAEASFILNYPPKLALNDIHAVPGEQVTLNIAASDPGDTLTYHISSPQFYSSISEGNSDLVFSGAGDQTAFIRLPKNYFVLSGELGIVPVSGSSPFDASMTVAGKKVWAASAPLFGYDSAVITGSTGLLYDSSLSYDNFYLGRYDKAKWDRWYYGGLSKPISADIIRFRTSGSGLFGISDGTKPVYVVSVGSAQTDVTVIIRNNAADVYYNGVLFGEYDLSILKGPRRINLYSLTNVQSIYLDNLSNHVVSSYPVTLDAASINSFLEACTADSQGYCDVPVTVQMAAAGKLTLSGIKVAGYRFAKVMLPNAIYYYGAPFDIGGTWAAEEGNYTFDVLVSDQFGASDFDRFRLLVSEAGAALAGAVIEPGYSAPDSSFASGSADSPFNPSDGSSDDGAAPSLPIAAGALALAGIGGAAYVMRGSLAAFISRYYSGVAARPGEIAAQEAKNQAETDYFQARSEQELENQRIVALMLAQGWNDDMNRIRLAEAQAAATREAALMLASQGNAPKPSSQPAMTKSQMSGEAYQAGLALNAGQKSSTTIGGTVFDISKDAKGNVSVTPHWTTAPVAMTPAQQQAAAEARARADRTRADILSAATKYDTISMPSATVFTDNRGRNVLLRGEEAENYTEAVDLRSDLRFAMPDEEMPDTLIYCHPTTMPDAMAISATWRQDALSDPSITKIPLIGAYWDSEVGQYYTLVRDVYTGQFEKMWIDSETCEEIDTDPIGHFFDVMTPGCRDLGNEQSLGNFGWCGLDLIGMIPGLSFTKVGRVAKVAKVVDEIGDAAKATKIGEIVRIGERYLVKASEETLNTFRKPFDKFIGANRIKFSENRIIHFTEELKQGAQFIDTGMPNTRLNQIKKLFEIKTDSEVRDLIEKAIKTKPEPDIYNPGRVIYRTIDSKQRILKVIVDESDGTIITVIGEH